MPLRGHHSSLVRIVEGVRGEVPMRLDLRLRFDYGLMPPWSRRTEDCFVADVGPDLAAFHASMPIDTAGPDALARFAVGAGQRFPFALSYGSSSESPPKRPDAEAALKATVEFWERWINRFEKPCHWPAAIKRSLITLKALVHQKTGGLIAAATLGLPEASTPARPTASSRRSMASSRRPSARRADTPASAPSAPVILMIAGKRDFSRINPYAAA